MIYGEGRTQIPLKSAATKDLLAENSGQTESILIQKLQAIPRLIK